jgi:hypothetical protein
MSAALQAQLLPDTVYSWRKTNEQVTDLSLWKAAPGEDASMIAAYGSQAVLEAAYERGSESVRIRIVEFPSRERAFGFFRAGLKTLQAHGIPGDAFAIGKGVTDCAFGPFAVRIEATRRRSTAPTDEALLLAVKRALYRKADCYGSDFPLTVEERVLGSERYLVPDAAAWVQLSSTGLDPVRDIVEKHAAWSAEYHKPRLGIRRLLLAFPFRQPAAAASFAEALISRCGSRGRSVDEGCRVPQFVMPGAVVYIVPAAAEVLLILTDAQDRGCCGWAERAGRR